MFRLIIKRFLIIKSTMVHL